MILRCIIKITFFTLFFSFKILFPYKIYDLIFIILIMQFFNRSFFFFVEKFSRNSFIDAYVMISETVEALFELDIFNTRLAISSGAITIDIYASYLTMRYLCTVEKKICALSLSMCLFIPRIFFKYMFQYI